MSNCNTCVNPTSEAKQITPTGYRIQQLSKMFRSECKDEFLDVYPVTILQAIKDACTGKKLSQIIEQFNHLRLDYKCSFETTVGQLSPKQRKKGLVVSFEENGVIKTYRYKGKSCSKDDFLKRENWDLIPLQDTYSIPLRFRLEGNRLYLDSENQDLEESTIFIDLPLEKAVIKNKIVQKLPFSGVSDTIYLVPITGSREHLKYIWIDALKKFEPLNSISTYGGSCVNPTLGSTDTYTEEIVVEEGVLKLKRNDGVILEVELPKTTAVPTDLEDRVKALEDKTDADTIFDPTAILERLDALEGKEDKDTIFDPTDITRRIEILEGKEDKDTIFNPAELLEEIKKLKEEVETLKQKEDRDTVYDDTELRNKITALESKEDRDTNKFITSGEIISEDLIRVYFNDGTQVDITKKPVVIPKFSITLGNNIQSNHPSGEYDSGTEFRLTPKSFRGRVFSKFVDSVSGDVTTNPYVFNLTESKNIDVVYTDLPRYTIAANNVRVTDTNPFQGETVTVTISAPTGKRLVRVVDSIEGDKGVINTYRFVANSDRTIIAEFEDILKPRVYFGHQEGYATEMSIEAVQESSVEVEALPVELDFRDLLPIGTAGTHGYWGIAVPKELTPTAPTIQMLFNGGWTNVLAGSYNLTEEEIGGKQYFVFRDNQKNRNFNLENNTFKLKVIR